jgi:fructan beta-fructosidase
MKKVFTLTLLILSVFSVNAQKVTRSIAIGQGHKFLNLPVHSSKNGTKMRIKAKGKTLDEFVISLTNETPEFWAFFDTTPYQGQTLEVEADAADAKTIGLDKVFPDSKFPGQENLYQEKSRQLVHFSSRRGWLNDPNGLIYHNGNYHLFYQHNAYGWGWGNMHWGHAISKDLVHWKELPVALYTPVHEDMAFSGSAVVDPKNTGGFRKNGIDPIIAFFTSTGRGECIALSYDNGLTFEEYKNNPVVTHKGRDPKVIWYEPGKHWVMVVWDDGDTEKMSNGEDALVYQHKIYTSPDLKNWTYQSSNRGFYECPELFEIEVAGEKNVKKWVMYDASGRYQVGSFNGKKFTPETPHKGYDLGRSMYASQTYSNIPASDGRRIQIGWARIDTKGEPFNQSMAFPTSLILKKTYDGYRLCPTPVAEIKNLHQKTHLIENTLLQHNESKVTKTESPAIHLIAEFEKGDAYDFGVTVNGHRLNYSHVMGKFNTTNYPTLEQKTLKIEVITDRSLIEVFVNDGELYFVEPLDPQAEKKVEVYAKRGKVLLKKLEVHELKSSWITD